MKQFTRFNDRTGKDTTIGNKNEYGANGADSEQITERYGMENREINKRLTAIYDTFGEESQMSKLFEECVELLNAIESGIKKDIISEIADVFCVTLQFYLKNKQIQKAVVEKITRTEERIESGFYERQE